MENTIHNVETSIVIHFSDGRTFNLPMADPNQIDLNNYCTSARLKEQLYTQNNNNIIGNVSANTLSLTIQSKDGLLISSNTSSTYYGLMNESAYISIQCTGEDDVTTNMGLYYVDTWENGVTASTANEVSINAINLLGKLKNIPLRKIRLQRDLSISDYLQSILDKLNSTLPSNMQINYNLSDLNIFGNSGYNYQLWFNNIDRDTFENILNNIAQNTLSHLWIDRNNYFKTDWLIDDTSETTIADLSGSLNVLDYGTQLADTSNASGVEVTYIDNVSYEDKELANIDNYELKYGLNNLENINLNSDKVLSINTIEITCSIGDAYVVSLFNYKNTADIKIWSSQNSSASIKIFGTIIKETTNINTLYKDQNSKSNIIVLDNKILKKELISTFTQGLLNLTSIRNNCIYVEGFINPQLKIGDSVDITGTKLGISGTYKIIGMDFTLGTNYRCKVDLIKTFGSDSEYEIPLLGDITTELSSQNQLFLNRLNGQVVDITDYDDITQDEEEYFEKNNEYKESADELERALAGYF